MPCPALFKSPLLLFAMLPFVLILNLLIVLFCWYGVKQIRRVRQQLTTLADNLDLAEQRLSELLQQSPQTLQQGQQSLQRWRGQYQQLQRQLQQGRQLLSLLGLGQLLWQQMGRNQTRLGAAATADPKAKIGLRGRARRLSQS